MSATKPPCYIHGRPRFRVRHIFFYFILFNNSRGNSAAAERATRARTQKNLENPPMCRNYSNKLVEGSVLDI